MSSRCVYLYVVAHFFWLPSLFYVLLVGSSAPDVADEAAFLFERVEESLGFVRGELLFALLQNLGERGGDVLRHVRSVAADEDVGVRGAYERGHLFRVLAHAVLDVHLFPLLLAGEGGDEARERPVRGERLELLFVEVILVRAAAAEKEPRGPELRARAVASAPAVLEKAAEGGDTRSGADQEHGRAAILGRAKHAARFEVDVQRRQR
mmetsp:Transcript_1566/g.5750  ORF Transcript_1566/g.5750 Transcript_1566/m.5750 type:complete len:208 (-) Transcript_1566:2313-2936(-)